MRLQGPMRRFQPDSLFRPRSVVLLGADTDAGGLIARNMAGFEGRFTALPADAAVPDAHDLAVLSGDGALVRGQLQALGQAGVFAAVCTTPVPGLAAMAREARVRVLGPASFGLIVPGIGLNASTAHVPVAAGRVALVSQSAALCRAVLDWAGPNGVGFSHVVGQGGNADAGFSLALDWLSRDPNTGAILLDIRTIRDRRSFLAAARAAARLRPVVALRAGGRLADPSGQADRVFDAALRRAGVLRVSAYADLLGAAEIQGRVRPLRQDRLSIVTNALGPAHLAADAAVAQGIELMQLDAVAQAVLALRLPQGPADPGVVWTGSDQPTRLAEAAALLGGLKETGGVIVIMAPGGTAHAAGADAAGAEALVALNASLRVPMLTCVLGETTGAGLRQRLAGAGLAVFASPEASVRAFGQLVAQRRARAAAVELPPRRVLRLAPDHASVRRILEGVRQAGRDGLLQDEALAVLEAYGLPTVPGRAVATAEDAVAAAALLGYPAVVKRRRTTRPAGRGAGGLALSLPDPTAVRAAAERLLPSEHGLLVQRQVGRARELRLTLDDDTLFGPAIGFGLGGTASDLLADVAYDLPPLNLVLARALVARTRAGQLLAELRDQPAADPDAVADALVRLSQLAVDHPEIGSVDINPLFADEAGVSAADAWIGLRPLGEQAVLAITPYPEELAETFDARGEALTIRPIRPEDAEAHRGLFSRLPPEDIRYRFFNMMRDLPPEQIARMTQVDYDREMAFVAVRGAETVGVSRLVWEPGTQTAEFAIVVEPSMKGRGVARRLMQRLVDWARSKELENVTGQVLAENAPMLAFMRRFGAEIHRVPDEPEIVEAVIALR